VSLQAPLDRPSAADDVEPPALARSPALRLALVGNPNCGKTALFNALTGARQKVANYPGVTVERKEGVAQSPSGATLRILDLPGTYSLRARSPDEVVTRDVAPRDVVLGVPARVVRRVADSELIENWR